MKLAIFTALLGAFLSVSSVHAIEATATSATDFATLEQWTALQDQQFTTEANTSATDGSTAISQYRRPYYSWRCYAQNRRGDIFREYGYNRYETQDRAMRTCFYYSRACRPLGCERIW